MECNLERILNDSFVYNNRVSQVSFPILGSNTDVRGFLIEHCNSVQDELDEKDADSLKADFQKMLDCDDAFFRAIDVEIRFFQERWKDVTAYRNFYRSARDFSDADLIPDTANLLGCLFYFQVVSNRMRLFLQTPPDSAVQTASLATEEIVSADPPADHSTPDSPVTPADLPPLEDDEQNPNGDEK